MIEITLVIIFSLSLIICLAGKFTLKKDLEQQRQDLDCLRDHFKNLSDMVYKNNSTTMYIDHKIKEKAKYKVGDIVETNEYIKFSYNGIDKQKLIIKNIVLDHNKKVRYTSHDGKILYERDIIRKCECDKPKKTTKRSKK
jgi:hypothetical protein